ncbi:hypothetical protein KALB_8413 [Kutzneria albida DSM 43870]|uniref:Uncharacterized protein n=1 Tax=Kutzneria albida DSM 43870 TaxID=1449976 RepID=W5WUE3_9PSEU|nr:hypothetical protein KALB_8413 [Kutzneria albida DSM 43870]
MVGVASTGTTQRVGAVLCAAARRAVITGGLVLFAWLLGSAVANAATAPDSTASAPTAASEPTTSETVQRDPGLLSRLITTLLGPQRQDTGGGSTSTSKDPVIPPIDVTGSGGGTSGGGGTVILPAPVEGGSGSGSSGSGSSGGGVWTGSTSVSVPVVKPAPEEAPPVTHQAPPPARTSQSTPDWHAVTEQVAATPMTVVASMSAPVTTPEPAQRPSDVPLQPQPASQPISSPSTGTGLSGHDLGGNSGLTGVVPPQTGFQPTPGSSTDELHAKRVSDGVPGLPSTSPD